MLTSKRGKVDGCMIILGIDPGTRLLGYGVIEAEGSRYRPVEFGTVKIHTRLTFPEKLLSIHQQVSALLDRFKPDEVAIEESYVTQNAKTTLRLGHARGVILLAAARKKIPIGEYAPRTVKQSVCGVGNAGKQQVRWMVSKMLGLAAEDLEEDASDALAVCLCHILRGSFMSAIKR